MKSPEEIARIELLAEIRLAVSARPISPMLAVALDAPTPELRARGMADAREHGRRWAESVVLARRERIVAAGLDPADVLARVSPFAE